MAPLRLSLRDALRRLALAPGFSLVTILTLALGIGANTAIASVVYSVLGRPLAYADPERLVALWHRAPGLHLDRVDQSSGTFLLYRDRAQSLAGLGIYSTADVNVTGEGRPQRLSAARISASLLPVLGVQPAAGRPLSDEDERPGSAPVVLLSHALWARRFAADPAAIGRTLEVDGVPREIAGVLPDSFRFVEPEVEVFLPLAIDRARPEPGRFRFTGVGRLAPGVSAADAARDLDAVLPLLPEAYPGGIPAKMLADSAMHSVVRPLKEELVGEVAAMLWILAGTVGFILLIACANVANLLLVRSEGRAREMAVRSALGAGWRDLVGSWLSESLLLAAAGGALGLALAWFGVEVLVALGPANLPRRGEIRVDGVVLGFTAALSLATGLLFGLLPALRHRGARLARQLADGLRGSTEGRSRLAARNVLVAAQVALALVLLVGSGLMVKSFARLQGVDPGFRAAGVLSLRVSLPAATYADAPAVGRFLAEARSRIEALPGVEKADVVTELPLSGSYFKDGISIEDFPRGPDDLPPILAYVHVTPGYFETLGIPLLSGRPFEPDDGDGRNRSVVVSEAFAHHFWPGESPLGRRLQRGGASPDAWLTIAGVVGDVRQQGLADPPVEILYFPVVGPPASTWVPRNLSFAVRTKGEPAGLAEPVAEVIWGLDPDLPIAAVRTLEQVLAASTARTTFAMTLLAIAAAVAVALGTVGLYGVIAYAVARRTREIGVRMALGADRGRVASLVVGQGLRVIATGLAIGLAGAFALTRLLAGLLYGVTATDPVTFAGVSLLLSAIGLGASWLPARRAAAVEPTEALGAD